MDDRTRVVDRGVFIDGTQTSLFKKGGTLSGLELGLCRLLARAGS